MTDAHYERILADHRRPAMTTTADDYATQVELEDWKRLAAKSAGQTDQLLGLARDLQEIARVRKVEREDWKDTAATALNTTTKATAIARDLKHIAAKSIGQTNRLVQLTQDAQEVARVQQAQADRAHQITMAHLCEDAEVARGMRADSQRTKARIADLAGSFRAMASDATALTESICADLETSRLAHARHAAFMEEHGRWQQDSRERDAAMRAEHPELWAQIDAKTAAKKKEIV